MQEFVRPSNHPRSDKLRSADPNVDQAGGRGDTRPLAGRRRASPTNRQDLSKRTPPPPVPRPTSVPEPAPPRLPMSSADPACRVHSDHEVLNHAPGTRIALDRPAGTRRAQASSSWLLRTAVPVPTHLRVHRRDHTYGTLNDRLRVRMLTGWVHVTELQTRIATGRSLTVEANFEFE